MTMIHDSIRTSSRSKNTSKNGDQMTAIKKIGTATCTIGNMAEYCCREGLRHGLTLMVNRLPSLYYGQLGSSLTLHAVILGILFRVADSVISS